VNVQLRHSDAVPKSGWRCEDVQDIGVTRFTCEWCGHQHIRYVHTMRHPQSGRLKVGCICAGHLEGSLAAAYAREGVFKLAEARKLRWASKDWKRSKRGVLYANGDGFNVRIYPVVGGFGGIISSLANDWKLTSQHVHASEAKAKNAALKAMFSVKEAR
jgi:hypothetical protein